VWLLGSSTFSAQLAGMLGLPFSFAYHFAPALLDQAVEDYRANFKPSILFDEPQLMIAASVICAPSEEEARWLAGSSALNILQRSTGRMGPLSTPEEAAQYEFTAAERVVIDEALSSHIIGDPDAVRDGLEALATRTGASELMISTRVHAYPARERSCTLVAEHWNAPVVDTPENVRESGHV
jgi:luciferase family oxidoreductase group 1